MDFDTERFILEVEKRPPLYKKNLEEYCDRNLKDRLWHELGELFLEGWSEMSALEKKTKLSIQQLI